MNQPLEKENKFLESLLKRLQELDQENRVLKSKLTNKKTQTTREPYLQIKELIIVNKKDEQTCSLCDCELNAGKVVKSLKLYFCAGDCSTFMEKIIDDVIYHLRKK